MTFTKISDNQIDTATNALLTSLSFLNGNSELQLPTGDSDADIGGRPQSPAVGTIRFNTSLDAAEIYVADADGQGNAGWLPVGSGGPSLANDSVIRTNPNTITESAVIGASTGPEFVNAFSKGPLTIATQTPPVVITVESGSVWEIF